MIPKNLTEYNVFQEIFLDSFLLCNQISKNLTYLDQSELS